MSLLLCRQEPVTTPFYIEELGVHLHSSQELCYVIYHHPLLVMEDFVDTRLTGFIRSQLRMPFLAERLEKWLEGRGTSDELLFLILQECFYCSPQEQTRYRQEVTSLRRLSEEEYQKRRADYFYERKLYGKAMSIYEKILESGKDKNLSGAFKGKIWNNIAACYTKLFCYQKAMHAYDCAYCEDAGPDYLRQMFFLTVMEPDIEVKEKYQELMSQEMKEQWLEEAVKVRTAAGQEGAVTRILQLFEKDSVKRAAKAAEILNQWKLEYRKMI